MINRTQKQKEYDALIMSLRINKMNNESTIDKLKNRNNEIDRTILRYKYSIEEIEAKK